MSDATGGAGGRPPSQSELDAMVAAADTGGRRPDSHHVRRLLVGVAFAWSLFQLWYASPLPFLVAHLLPVLNDTEARSIHLAFAVFLAFTAYPAFRRSPRDRVPAVDWVLALLGSLSAGYLFLFYGELAQRPGLPNTQDLVVAGVGMATLLEATRRALGPPLMIVALLFLAYVFLGHLAPEVIAWKGASFERAMSHMWLTTEGVFGIALGVSTSFVFLFVLFGSLLDKAGAGNYFIQLAFSLLGHLRGGPAKAAVLASGLTGLISGSSIANTVTTGTFTIPLMRRVGFPATKAGAVEVAASVNGQIMPPVMGAAAFLMVEYVGISYVDVIRHAFLPAVISYVALLYIVHLEAVKAGMEGLKSSAPARTILQRINLFVLGAVVTAALCAVAWFGLAAIRAAFGGASGWGIFLALAAVLVGLIAWQARFPDLHVDDPAQPMAELPRPGAVARTGLHYILPIVVLVWCLMVERLSPGLSAFWATTMMVGLMLTQRPLRAAFRGEGGIGAAARRGWDDLFDGMVAGARNMIGIGVATAAAGIIVGTVSLTGIGQVMTELVELISGGNLVLMLVLVAVISLILGMGLPTTANYIVVSSLMAGVVVELGAQSGLIVPLIAVHLFVFYFGIMADVTPPVGLASFAAAAISGADPLRTGFQAFWYTIRTAALPFLFIFNTKLLLIGIEGPFDLLLTVASALTAMLVFVAATQGFFLARSRVWETAALLLVAFTLFRPGYWLDQVADPYTSRPGAELAEVVAAAEPGDRLRLSVEYESLTALGDEIIAKQVPLVVPEGADGAARLEALGLVVTADGDRLIVDNVGFGSPAEEAGIEFDWRILSVEQPNVRPPKELFFLPALLLLALVAWLQRRRAPPAAARPGAFDAAGRPA